MTTENLPAKKPKPKPIPRPNVTGDPPPIALGFKVVDLCLLVTFLALTFLLGAFPLKDTDFWWHLKTGDLIRQTGKVPTVDIYTFAAAGKPWIDLHWIFQVLVSWGYEWGGVRLLTLGKCAITTIAVFFLVTARKREWPLWAMLIAWFPAILVLGGRMYVRPETLTLLYIAIFMAVLVRIDRRPWLALVLPFVQVAWVNTQGLFVFGPILLGFAILDAAVRPGAFAPTKSRWWKTIGIATVLTGFACFVNPYGISGALYPLQLARTMANPIFSNEIAELTPIPVFIARDGLISLPLRLQLLALFIGACSFLVPLVWVVVTRLRPLPSGELVKLEKPKGKGDRKSRKGTRAAAPPRVSSGWSLSVFRLLLFVSFSVLSMRATRNSHQFAAVVGALTAWNFGEWAAAIRRRAWLKSEGEGTWFGPAVFMRVFAATVIGSVLVWVASEKYYEAAGEGRVIGLGEEPLWFPHEAVKFTGTPGMPDRFLAFHIGHASLYDYYFGPEKKVYVDARLEVIGPELYERYSDLYKNLTKNEPVWPGALEALGRPVVLIDNDAGNSAVGSALLTNSNWRCVRFDPVASVYVHRAFNEVIEKNEVDFAARHFHPTAEYEPHGSAEFLAAAKGLRNIGGGVLKYAGPDRALPFSLLGMNYARRVAEAWPDRPDGWKLIAQFELFRETATPDKEPIPRFRMAFDPVFDLAAVRLTYAARRALQANPEDFLPNMILAQSYMSRGMNEAALTKFEKLVTLNPINGQQTEQQQVVFPPLIATLRSELGPTPSTTYENRSLLGYLVNKLLNAGRAETAARALEFGIPAEARSWEDTDRVAVLWLHLGEPHRARATLQAVAAPPRPALRDARVALTYLVEGAFDKAREAYKAAIAADPKLFEAHYGLAVLEQDAGRASEALASARKAVDLVADGTRSPAQAEEARKAAQKIVATVTPYARSAIAKANIK